MEKKIQFFPEEEDELEKKKEALLNRIGGVVLAAAEEMNLSHDDVLEALGEIMYVFAVIGTNSDNVSRAKVLRTVVDKVLMDYGLSVNAPFAAHDFKTPKTRH